MLPFSLPLIPVGEEERFSNTMMSVSNSQELKTCGVFQNIILQYGQKLMAIWIVDKLRSQISDIRVMSIILMKIMLANFIVISNSKNVWVRNISALHFVTSVVQSNAGSKWITVQDCESREPVSIRVGGRRFIYQMNGQLCLVQRCFSQKGRHSFVLQGSEASGNVYLDCQAVNPYSTSEPHNRWVNGILYDNVKAPLTARYWRLYYWLGRCKYCILEL